MSQPAAQNASLPASATVSAVSVLVVSHVSGVWGAQRRLLDIAPLLADQGVELTLACPPGELGDLWTDIGRDFEPLELPEHRGLRPAVGTGRPGPMAIAAELSSVLRSAGVIARRARHFDIVQSHSLWAHLETAIAAKLARRACVLDLHDIVNEGGGRTVLGAAARLSTVVLANSGATASTVPRAANKTHIVHPGVDTSRFHPGPADPDVRAQLTSDPSAPLVAILGRIDPSKGVDVLVEAMGRLGDGPDGPHLAIVGQEHLGPAGEAQALRRRAHELLAERVRFVPPRDDIPTVLRSVDVLVNASQREPFGRTVLEAQASGIPVIGTDAGGIPEFVRHGHTGLLIPPQDVAALERALRDLLADPDLQRRLGSNAAEQAKNSFSVEAQSRAAAAVYRSAVGG